MLLLSTDHFAIGVAQLEVDTKDRDDDDVDNAIPRGVGVVPILLQRLHHRLDRALAAVGALHKVLALAVERVVRQMRLKTGLNRTWGLQPRGQHVLLFCVVFLCVPPPPGLLRI